MEKPEFNERSIAIFVACGGAFFTGLAMISLSFCGDITPITVVSHYSIVSFVTLQILFTITNGLIPVKILALIKQHFVLLLILGLVGTIGKLQLLIVQENLKGYRLSGFFN